MTDEDTCGTLKTPRATQVPTAQCGDGTGTPADRAYIIMGGQ